MRFDGLEGALAPFAIILVATWLWHLFCFFYLAPRLLPDAWVERAVAELGQSMGVTSTGT
jgi:ESS family glutamate:Na+ symporter